MIIVEGIDNTGKSTLIHFLAQHLRLPVQASEGPPRFEGEMEERLMRYRDLPTTIFDRHPIVSQFIYGSMRNDSGFNTSKWFSWLYTEKRPFIIYCDPAGRGLGGHKRNVVDTDEHLKQIENNYELLLNSYRRWAMAHANYIYRIGDDMNRVLHACQPRIDLYADIQDFHERFELEYKGPPRHLPEDLLMFRIKFMAEELCEYAGLDDEETTFVAGVLAGRLNKDHFTSLTDQLDALVDLVYVALGTAHMQGFDFNEAWRRVHEANMKKIRVLKAIDSKRNSTWDVIKPDGWTPPDLSDLVYGDRT